MDYKLILKMAGMALGTIVIEQVLGKSGKQTEATLISYTSIAIMIALSMGTLISAGNGTIELFKLGE